MAPYLTPTLTLRQWIWRSSRYSGTYCILAYSGLICCIMFKQAQMVTLIVTFMQFPHAQPHPLTQVCTRACSVLGLSPHLDHHHFLTSEQLLAAGSHLHILQTLTGNFLLQVRHKIHVCRIVEYEYFIASASGYILILIF